MQWLVFPWPLTQLPICWNWLLADLPMKATATRMMIARMTMPATTDPTTTAMTVPAEDFFGCGGATL